MSTPAKNIVSLPEEPPSLALRHTLLHQHCCDFARQETRLAEERATLQKEIDAYHRDWMFETIDTLDTAGYSWCNECQRIILKRDKLWGLALVVRDMFTRGKLRRFPLVYRLCTDCHEKFLSLCAPEERYSPLEHVQRDGLYVFEAWQEDERYFASIHGRKELIADTVSLICETIPFPACCNLSQSRQFRIAPYFLDPRDRRP